MSFNCCLRVIKGIEDEDEDEDVSSIFLTNPSSAIDEQVKSSEVEDEVVEIFWVWKISLSISTE